MRIKSRVCKICGAWARSNNHIHHCPVCGTDTLYSIVARTVKGFCFRRFNDSDFVVRPVVSVVPRVADIVRHARKTRLSSRF